MFYILALTAIILGILNEKSKTVTLFQLLVIWILLGWSYGNADYPNYLTRYTYYDSSALGERTEFLFFQLFKLGNQLGLSYDQFLIVVALIFVIAFGSIIRKVSQNPNLVLSLYLVFPASVDATQIRFALASILILLGFSILFNDDIRLGEIYYAVLVVIAALFHIGTILFMFMLPIRRLNKKRTYLYTILVSVAIAVLGMGGAQRILSLFPNMLTKLSLISTSNITRIIYWVVVEMIVWIVLLIVLHLFERYVIRNNLGAVKNYNYIYKAAVISVITIPVTLFFQDAYRILQCICILLYCSLSNVFPAGIVTKRGRGKFATNGTRNTLLFMSFVFAFLFLYAIVLNSSNFETVFIPYFEDNKFFDFIFRG